jgi:hypothetical protein
MGNCLSGLRSSNGRGVDRPDVERPSIEATGTLSPDPQPPREMCGMPAGRLAKRVAIGGAGVVLVGGVLTTIGVLVDRARHKMPELRLKDILPRGEDTYFDQYGITSGTSGRTPFSASLAAVTTHGQMPSLLGENSEGHLTFALAPEASESTTNATDATPREPVEVDQNHLKQFIKDAFPGKRNYSKIIDESLGFNGELGAEIARTAMAQRLIQDSEKTLTKGLSDVDKLNTQYSLHALTGNQVEEFNLEDCGKPTKQECHDEAYIKIATALNAGDPVVITTPKLDFGQNGISVISDSSYPVYAVHPRGVLEGDTYSPKVATEISVQTDPSTNGGEDSVWLGTKMDKLGKSSVSIGHIDGQKTSVSSIPLTPQISPEPIPSPPPPFPYDDA